MNADTSRAAARTSIASWWRRCLRAGGLRLVWAVRRQRPPDFLIGPPGEAYLERWWLLPRNRICNVYLHHFRHSDDDRALHDHPWCYLSLMLHGRYREFTRGPAPGQLASVVRPTGSIALHRARHTHRIALVDDRSCWTLFITGPRVREWGFHCPRGWISWRQFTAPGAEGQVGAGCGEPQGSD